MVGEEVGIDVGALVGAFVGSFVGCGVCRMQKLYPAGSLYKALQHSSIEQEVVTLGGGLKMFKRYVINVRMIESEFC